MMTRRHALRTLLGSSLAATALGSSARLWAQAQPAPTGPFTLPPLPYPFDALEPHIDARTMEIHHDKHHAAYVANLNKAVADYPDLQKKTVEELVANLDTVPEAIRTAVRNNGGGHLNHSWFWQMMSKSGGGQPKGEVAAGIDKAFKSYDGFKEAFTKAAMGQFGSGWAWLCWDANAKVMVIQPTPNQDSPVSSMPKAMRERYGLKGGAPIPLLGIDVWEHAYYLKYQNRRADYVAAFYNVINWDFVAERLKQAAQA